MFFYIFLLSIFSDISAIQVLFPILGKIYFQKIITAAALAGLLFDTNCHNNIKDCLNSKQGYVIIFLFIWMVLSVPFSMYPGGSFRFLTENFWKVIAVFLMILAYSSSKEHLNKIIWTYILSIIVLTILTIKGAGISRFTVGGGYDPNDTALVLLMAFPFLFWKHRTSAGIKRVILGFSSLLLIIGIIATQSRGGFLGLIAVVCTILFQVLYAEKKGLVKVLFGVLIFSGIIFYYGGDAYYERISSTFDTTGNYNYGSHGRLALWKRGMDMMINNPMLGVGVNAFMTADGLLYTEEGSRWNTAHNSFVQLGAELGFPGLIAFCLLIWGSIRNVRKIPSVNGNAESDSFRNATAYSIIGSWVGFIVSGSFLSAAYISPFYFLLAISLSFINLNKQKTTHPNANHIMFNLQESRR